MNDKTKKIMMLILVSVYCLLNLPAGAFSETKKIDPTSVKNIEIELLFENLTVSTWNGNQIVVTFESNKKDVFPQISTENKILQLRKTDSGIKYDEKASFCDISLMLPENYQAEKISIKAPYGKLDIKKMNARIVSITPGPENSLANITADFFKIPLPDEADINISNLDCNSFDITLFVGDANLSLARAPEKKSKISVKEGKLNISIPSESSFTILADSYHSKFINNFTGKVDSWARDTITYKHNGGGPEIDIRNFKGDITVGGKSK